MEGRKSEKIGHWFGLVKTRAEKIIFKATSANILAMADDDDDLFDEEFFEVGLIRLYYVVPAQAHHSLLILGLQHHAKYAGFLQRVDVSELGSVILDTALLTCI
jgi:hypothetical protein